MRITHEADYAIRVACCLAVADGKVGAKQISEMTGVTLRFALKILRKMILGDLVKSFKGVSGGYQLARAADQISLGEIIEVIDGPIEINHCLSSEFDCSRVQQKNECTFHRLFSAINQDIRSKLYDLPLSQFVPEKNQA